MTDLTDLAAALIAGVPHDYNENGERVMLETEVLAALSRALDPALFAELVEALRRAKTELEMLRAKDTGAVYDVTLRLDLDALLAKIGGGA